MPFRSGDICPAGGTDIRASHAPRTAEARSRIISRSCADECSACANLLWRGRFRLNTAEPILERKPPSSALGHFDEFPPTNPSVGSPLDQRTFADTIRQLPRRAGTGSRGRSTPRRRLKLSRRQADDRLLRLRFAIIVAPSNLRPVSQQKITCGWSGCCVRAGREWSVSGARPHRVEEEVDDESWCSLSAD
jgi:hypothetical protein